MIKSDKKLRELALVLEKKNIIQSIQAIRKIRDEEPFEGAIALLVAAFSGSDDKSLRNTIGDFFNDLKDLSARPEIFTELRKHPDPATVSMLIASCWQSGLDYSDYTEDVVNIFLTCDYPTSIECMTLIGESASSCSRERKDELIGILRNADSVWNHEKKSLTEELIGILG